jgi:Fe-S cluster assembly protein SufD
MYSVNVKEVFKTDPKAILSFREAAKGKVDTLKFPNIGKLSQKAFMPEKSNVQQVLLDRAKQIPEEVQKLLSKSDENVIIMQDGNIIYETLSSTYKDVYINDFHSAFEERPELVLNLLSRMGDKQENQMVALNSAYFNSGIVVDIPKNLEIKDNIVLVHLQKRADMVHRSLIHVDRFSWVNITEYFLDTTPCYANVVTDLILEDEAHVVYTGIDQFQEGTKVYLNTRGLMQRNTSLHVVKVYLSDANVIGDIDVVLAGEGGRSTVETVAVARNQQFMGLNVNTNNAAKRTDAQISNHGVVHDKAKLLFNAIGKVDKGCVGSNAYQKTRGVILSDKAEINANPYLIIDEYDVEGAGHAATVGRFEENDIHYMMSRGIPRKQAETMVIHGFVKPVIEEIPNVRIQEYVFQAVKEKLGTIE